MTTEQLVLQYGMAGAVLAAIAMFLKYLKSEQKDRAEERSLAAEERTRFLEVLEKYRHLADMVISGCQKEKRRAARQKVSN